MTTDGVAPPTGGFDPATESAVPASVPAAAPTAEPPHAEPQPTAEAPSPVPAVPVTPGMVFRWAVAAAFGVGLVVAGAMAVYTVRAVLIQVLIALYAAISLDPAVRWLIRRGVRRSIAVTVIFLLALLLLAGFFWSVTPLLIDQATKLVDDAPSLVADLTARSKTYRDFATEHHLTQQITEYLSSLPGKIGGDVFGFVRQTLGAVFNVLLVVVLTIYFMADLPRMRRGMVRLAPRERRPQVAQAVNVVVDKVGGYMIGNLIISLFAGVSTFVCLEAVRVPFALPLAFFVALTDLIPLVGATIGAVGCVLVSVFTVDIWPNAIVVVLFFVAYQQLENYFIAPRVLRNTVDLSSVTVLLAALIGGSVLGVVGSLMAIPIAAAAKVIMTPMVRALDEPPPGRPLPAAEPPVAPPRRRWPHLRGASQQRSG